jgi:IS30 family transposase
MAKNKKKHISKEERFCIKRMLDAKETFTEVARILVRGLSTISEEVNKNGGRDKYDPIVAERRAYLRQYRKKRGCNKVAMDGPLTRFVEKSLRKGLSPEATACRLKKENKYQYASGKSIRKFVDSRCSLERFLFWNRNNMKSGRKRRKGLFLNDPDRKWIDIRPIEALYEYGHWEGDFIVSKWNPSVLLVLVEKYTKSVLLAILPNRNNDLVNLAIVSLLKDSSVKSLTLDNDIAFGKWKQLEEKLGTKIYFTHPYHSWEKGLVENTNRWLREFIKKGSDISNYSEYYIKWIEAWFNHKPRECLEGFTPYEKMMECQFKKEVESLEVNFPRLRIWG